MNTRELIMFFYKCFVKKKYNSSLMDTRRDKQRETSLLTEPTRGSNVELGLLLFLFIVKNLVFR